MLILTLCTVIEKTNKKKKHTKFQMQRENEKNEKKKTFIQTDLRGCTREIGNVTSNRKVNKNRKKKLVILFVFGDNRIFNIRKNDKTKVMINVLIFLFV